MHARILPGRRWHHRRSDERASARRSPWPSSSRSRASAWRATPAAWDYYAGGAGDELSLADNREAWDRLRLRPRMLVDVSQRDLRRPPRSVRRSATRSSSRRPPPTTWRTPTPRLTTARGAAAAGALFTLSTISTVPMEDVAAAAPGAPRWFQLYAPSDRAACQALVERAARGRLFGDRR